MDSDLQSRQQARELLRQAETAQQALEALGQEKLDRIVQAVAEAFSARAGALGMLACQETGFGNPEDKEFKNKFASLTLYEAIKNMKTLGILREDQEKRLWEIGVPVGVIAAIVPSTNPTSTVCYKTMIALKSGNAIVFSPHPKALKCTLEAVKICRQAAEAAGAPAGVVSALELPSLEGTRELMEAPETRLILATGGPAMVKAAYSSGKPAIGVGAGNDPAYIHRSADVREAMEKILRSKTFDYGTVCASEQSILAEKATEEAVVEAGKALGFYFMNEAEAGKLSALLFRPNGSLNPEVVGKPAGKLAKLAGFPVPEGTKILVALDPEQGSPYEREKLCPVLAMYTLPDEGAVLGKALALLSREGRGHTFAIHSRDEAVVRKFALSVPVSRFLVNAPAAQGGVGAESGLFPALTLGCGAAGGSASSNNISPLDLINIRRVAWGTDDGPGEDPEAALVEKITAKILERLK